MNICKKLSLFALSLIVFGYSASAQVSISTLGPGGAYTQDFSALGVGNFALTDNTSIIGVYALRTFGNASPNTFFADDGSDGFPELNNYGSTGSADRALGGIADSAPFMVTGDVFYGIRFQNDSPSAITSIEVRYVGEQWRDASTAAQTLTFSFRQDPGDITDLTSGSYTTVPSLTFVTPTNNGGGVAIDGNAATNRDAIISGFAVNVPIGGEIMLRWTDVGDAFNTGHGIAIDDVVVIARAGTTAADATISGRVTTASGRSISGARMVLTGGDLTQPVYALTNAFGYFSFAGIESGRIYAVTVNSKRYQFANPTRAVDLSDNAFDVNFVAEP